MSGSGRAPAREGAAMGAAGAPADPLDLCALLYCARSGSTFLAFRLAEAAPDLAVIPEFRLPLLLLWRSEARVRALTPAGLLSLMREDMQFSNLEIPEAARPALAARLAGGGTREVIEGVLRVHLAGAGLSDRRRVLLKNSELALNGPRLRACFPEIRALHLRRDPRAVVNSMLSARQAYDAGRPMAHGDPVYGARLWTRYMARVAALDFPVRELVYEALVEAPEAEARAAADWLRETSPLPGTPSAPPPAPPPASGAFRVGAAERDLHRRAARAAAADRGEAWRAEAPARQVRAVEAVAGAEMLRRGYALAHPGPGGGPPALPLRARLEGAARQAGHYAGAGARLFGWLLRDPRQARLRLRLFLARQMGRN